MTPKYRIHPGLGIARLGNSPTEFYLAPETPAALPTACDEQGNPLLCPDGTSEVPVRTFKDAAGRIKRQAARFQVWVYDDESPEGRPLKLGDPIRGGGNDGTLIDIQWRVYLANKKASWYEFQQQEGEHGYAPDHPRRNLGVEGDEARQRLIIDPGPRTADCSDRRQARFDRESGDVFAATFPPPLEPCSIDTLGELKTDDVGRLLVLGGHGNSGTYLYDQFGQPRIDDYANNDGWFDDTSDGPVTARLVMFESRVNQVRFIDVEYPAWVLAAYPAYVPQVLDMVTMDEVLEDLYVRKFATRTDLYGTLGTFDDPQHIDPTHTEALIHWRAGRVTFNAAYKPWFYRDIWPILFRPDEFTYLTTVLGQSNFPHNQSKRGNFDPYRLGVPPVTDHKAVAEGLDQILKNSQDGQLLITALEPDLTLLERGGTQMLRRALARGREIELQRARQVVKAVHDVACKDLVAALKAAAAAFAKAVGADPSTGFDAYVAAWRSADARASEAWKKAEEALDKAVGEALEASQSKAGDAAGEAGQGDDSASEWAELLLAAIRSSVRRKTTEFISGQLLLQARAGLVAEHTYDPFRAYRRFLWELLRQPGEENTFGAGGPARSRTYGLPLMPLLAGDNPISNTLPAKFLRLTDLQLFLLSQWNRGHFYNEEMEGWGTPDPWEPYADWQNTTARDIDRGVLMNGLGGAFCPGGEVGWILRNPSIYKEPYRIKADPDFYAFRQTAAQANNNRGTVSDDDYESYTGTDLSQDNDFDRGLQPGDLTKSMAVPWQADFNECTTQNIDVTYESWNDLYPESDGDSLLKREQRVWETLWWPAHRPLQVYTEVGRSASGSPSYRQLDWAVGVPQTNAGDLKMTTEWWRLGFVVRNPAVSDDQPSPDTKYISVERTEDERGSDHE